MNFAPKWNLGFRQGVLEIVMQIQSMTDFSVSFIDFQALEREVREAIEEKEVEADLYEESEDEEEFEIEEEEVSWLVL